MSTKLIVALDIDSFAKAKRLIDTLSPYIGIFKVGSELFTASGPKIIDYINKKRKKVFLDLKFYDIPNTVKKSVLTAAKHKVFMLTLHVSGGFEMLEEAASVLKGRKERPLLVGVTVLTSKKAEGTSEVVKLALTAKKAGLDGCVCSAKETKEVKKACGKDFIVVNPGIRPAWAAKHLSSETKHNKYLVKEEDQERVATPEEAIKNGADFIVIGRPITEAKDPVQVAKEIIEVRLP